MAAVKLRSSTSSRPQLLVYHHSFPDKGTSTTTTSDSKNSEKEVDENCIKFWFLVVLVIGMLRGIR